MKFPPSVLIAPICFLCACADVPQRPDPPRRAPSPSASAANPPDDPFPIVGGASRIHQIATGGSAGSGDSTGSAGGSGSGGGDADTGAGDFGGSDLSPGDAVSTGGNSRGPDASSGGAKGGTQGTTCPDVPALCVERRLSAVAKPSMRGCPTCDPPGVHLLISEIAVRPTAAQMIELFNPTAASVSLDTYALSDNNAYFLVADGSFSPSSGDFVAFFPPGARIGPGEFRTVGFGQPIGAESFFSSYGTPPDFEVVPVEGGDRDDPLIDNMIPAPQSGASIGKLASLAHTGEFVMLFALDPDPLWPRVRDVDYVLYGSPHASSLPVEKKVETPGGLYVADTPASLQHRLSSPKDSGSFHRCRVAELGETLSGGNGITQHDETSEDLTATFAVNEADPLARTPGAPPPAKLCSPAQSSK